MSDNIQQLKFFKSSSLEKAKQEFNTLFASKNSRLAVIFTLALNAAALFATLFFYRMMPPELPLFYSRPWGEEQLVSRQLFSIIIISSSVLMLINLRLASIFLKNKQILSQIIVWTNLLLMFLNTLNVFKIFSLTVF